MSFCTVLSAAIFGLKVEFVNVEADVSNGLPAFHMVGYLSSEVREAAERVRTAIKNSQLEFPAKKVVINLSPATMKKRGAAFDLPIALSILASLGHLHPDHLKKRLIVGELSLDGKVRPVPGVLPVVMEGRAAGITSFIVPKSNAPEGALVDGVEVIGVGSLKEVYLYLTGQLSLQPEPHDSVVMNEEQKEDMPDYLDICGQETVKRASEVAVAGGHNLLLIGPPGSGKTMTAQRISTILPELTFEESMEITKIYSIMGLLDAEHPLIRHRPFRVVHHTATKAAMVGGGSVPVPGEISLAHQGVLFLDELPEFQKQVLEVLRQPLEERQVRITRVNGNYLFPANFMLVAAMNPCPCGCYPDLNRCTCTPGQIQHYLGKISQPFLDRMDICVESPKISYEALHNKKTVETSEEIRKKVCRARDVQKQRYRGTNIVSNSMMGAEEIRQWCGLEAEGEELMRQAFSRLGLTARTYHKILKVARTIADLEGKERIQTTHLQEAIGYRTIDKKYWGR